MVFFDDRLLPWKRPLSSLKTSLKEALALVAQQKTQGRADFFDAFNLASQHTRASTRSSC